MPGVQVLYLTALFGGVDSDGPAYTELHRQQQQLQQQQHLAHSAGHYIRSTN